MFKKKEWIRPILASEGRGDKDLKKTCRVAEWIILREERLFYFDAQNNQKLLTSDRGSRNSDIRSCFTLMAYLSLRSLDKESIIALAV
jgi:hypothetical protein